MAIKLKSRPDVMDSSTAILYLVLFELDGKKLVKIGITTRTIEDRVSEILVGIFKKYREFPYCRPKKFTSVKDARGKEQLLHKYFKEFKYYPQHSFSGCTEFFEVDLDIAVEAYKKAIVDELVVPSVCDEDIDY